MIKRDLIIVDNSKHKERTDYNYCQKNDIYAFVMQYVYKLNILLHVYYGHVCGAYLILITINVVNRSMKAG